MTAETSSTPDGFERSHSGDLGPGPAYLDGVSVTYGQRRSHIWSFAVGYAASCPCSEGGQTQPPEYVGDNYFCDKTHSKNGKLWDGKDCNNNDECCTFHSPPWFNVRLPTSTTDEIEMRICGDQSTADEFIPVEYVEVYVQ